MRGLGADGKWRGGGLSVGVGELWFGVMSCVQGGEDLDAGGRQASEIGAQGGGRDVLKGSGADGEVD